MITNLHVREGLSWWEYEHFFKDVDYTIIGSGIVGISTAIELKKSSPNSKVLVIDKKSLPIGASTKNAGFACFGSVSEILDDYNAYGELICQKLIQMRWKGLSIMKSRVPESKMYYRAKPGAEIFKSKEEYEYYKEHLPFVNSLVSSIVGIEDCFTAQSGPFGDEIINKLEGSLNPQMLMRELDFAARQLDVMFLSGLSVDEIDVENKKLISNYGSITYNKLIICTNGFSRKLLPKKDIKPARNQVFITNRIPEFSLDCCYHMNKGFVYFREYDGRLLIGGGRDLDMEKETTDQFGTTQLISDYLNEIVQKYILPNQSYTIEQSWSGILGVGDTKMPMVEKIDNDVLIAVRMGGMGVAIGSFIGRVASSMIRSFDNSEHRLYVS